MPSGGENAACPRKTFYRLCKDGDKDAVKQMLRNRNASDPCDLFKGTCSHATSHLGTCLHTAVIGGNIDILKYLCPPGQDIAGEQRQLCEDIAGEQRQLCEDIAGEQDGYGNTAMHLAVRRNRVDLVKLLIRVQPKLCSSRNKKNETPLFVAVRLGVGEMVKALVDEKPDSVLELCGNKNVLHLAVELHLVHIVRFLTKHERVDLRQIVNHGAGLPLSDPDSKDKGAAEGEDTTLGDTPLHIAARRKCLQMVEFLLDVPGVDKFATNHQGFTPLEIAKEKTEYYERYKIIAKLSDYPNGHRPFMYNAPSPSLKKLENANAIVDKNYHGRQNAELVVAALLAAMTFSAVFQVPGGLQQENKPGVVIGTPTLIHFTSFKLFLIFDCVAFFLSLFVVFMWQMSSELTTGDKMLFMSINNLLVCLSFAFTASGFIAAVYVVLAHKVRIFSWVVLGIMTYILVVGCIASWYKAVTFSVTRARFNRLCGVPCVLDDFVEWLWLTLEGCHFLDILRKLHEWLKDIFIFGHCDWVKKGFRFRLCGNGRPERETPKTGEGGSCSPCPLYSGSQSA